MNSCDFVSKLERYIDEDIPSEELPVLVQHIESCQACTTQVKQLLHIERLVSSRVLQEPPAGYWERVPGEILQRLNIFTNDPAPVNRRSLADRVMDLFAIRGLQVGFAGAVATVLLLVFMRDSGFDTQQFPVVNGPLAVNQNVGQLPTETDVEPTTAVKIVGAENDGAAAANEQIFVSETGPDETKLVSLPVQELDFLTAEVPAKISARGLHQVAYKAVTILLPLPGPDLVLPPKEENMAGLSEKGMTPSSFGAKVSGDSNVDIGLRTPTRALPDQESDFAETAWIVQESKSLKEKKGIWLSFLQRETDRTYRALGVYNLALVLVDIAHESQDPDNAQEALDFFTEHEASLRFQMSDQRFSVNETSLRRIVE